jgi:hypothetical protein
VYFSTLHGSSLVKPLKLAVGEFTVAFHQPLLVDIRLLQSEPGSQPVRTATSQFYFVKSLCFFDMTDMLRIKQACLSTAMYIGILDSDIL